MEKLMVRIVIKFFCCIAITVFINHHCIAGDLAGKRVDRRVHMAPGELTTDDPRRIPVPPPQGDLGGETVLRKGRVFDGTGKEAFEATVVIKGKYITHILPPDSNDYSKTAEIIDVPGKTVMPGLIDLHTHLTYGEPGLSSALVNDVADATLRGVERLRFYLESGITTVRDVGSMGTVPFRLKEWVNEGRVPGPRIFAAGQLITGIGGHGAEDLSLKTSPTYKNTRLREASGADDWRAAVREQFKRGADLIKVSSHFSPEEIKAAIDEAHSLGLKVTVDAETRYTDIAVEAGVDCVEHPLPRSEKTVRLMAERGICADITLIPYMIIIDMSGGYYGSQSRRFTLTRETNFNLAQQLYNAGVTLGVGTDLVAEWFRFLPYPYIAELKEFIRLGYSSSEALVAATQTNATILDMEDKLGTLQPGKLADILVVNGRPDQNIDDLARVSMVIRDGRTVINDGSLVIKPHEPAFWQAIKRDDWR